MFKELTYSITCMPDEIATMIMSAEFQDIKRKIIPLAGLEQG